jgi:hypothetical protein
MSVNNAFKLILLFLVTFFFLSTSYSQPPAFAPAWNMNYGGSKDEVIAVVIPSADGGFLLAGTSFSGQSFDLTEPNRDSTVQSSDYWIIKTDQNGNKLWNRRFGGSSGETLLHAIATFDGGYLLSGTSFSGQDGDKTQVNHDSSLVTPDIWIVKTDSLGNKLWDIRLGGNQSEQMGESVEIIPGIYLIAGSTVSPQGGNISEPGQGGWDYWMALIDINGNLLSDKRFGGTADDFCTSVAADTGIMVLGGYTWSGTGGDKSQPNQGGADYWMIKADVSGNKLWDKSYGGTLNDWLFDITTTPDQYLVLGGQSFSGATGDKSEPNHDPGPNGSDRWIIKADSAGNKIWDRTYGADQIEDVNNIEVLANGNLLICGESYSSQNGNKSEPNLGPEQTWIFMTDGSGNILWDKTLFTFSHDEKGYAIMLDSSCFLAVNYTRADSSGYKTQDNYGEGDFWMIKMCPDTTLSVSDASAEKTAFEIMPNPAKEYCIIRTNGQTGDDVILSLRTVNGYLVWSGKPNEKDETRIDLTNFPSGIYLVEFKSEKYRQYKKLVILH